MKGRAGSLLEVGTGLHSELTGRESFFLSGAMLGLRKAVIRSRLKEIVEFADAGEYLDTLGKRYSSGMYIRLAFAVAAHLEPEIFLVDEGLTFGDAAFQEKCRAKMGDPVAEGRIIVFVSHNTAAISPICTRALWIDKGAVVAEGPTAEVVAKYQEFLSGQFFERSPEACVYFADRHVRYGSGDACPILSLTVCDVASTPCTAVPMGEAIKVTTGVRLTKPEDNPEVGVAISKLAGERVTHLVSAFEALSAADESAQYVFEATVSQLPVISGPYSLTIWVKTGVGSGADSDDGIDSALALEVLPSPDYGEVPPFEDYCQPVEVYLESRWEVHGI